MDFNFTKAMAAPRRRGCSGPRRGCERSRQYGRSAVRVAVANEHLAVRPRSAVPFRERSMDTFLGEIRLVGFNFAPQGWAFCNGQLLPIAQNTALFSLLGTTYGGDGQVTFALPDLRSR